MPLALIGFGLMILASNIVVTLFGADPMPIGPGVAGAELAELTALIGAPILRLVGVLCLSTGGLSYMSGIGPRFHDLFDDPHPLLPTAEQRTGTKQKPSYSQVARAASDRVETALGRLRSMPVETFSPEAWLDYEAIRDKHLPGLRAAHATARAAFPADGPDALLIDADLANSLDLIAGTLDALVADCGDEARSGFAVERRFVELRHPSSADPLVLPAFPIVERQA